MSEEEQQANDDFEAGFSGARGEEPPKPQEPTEAPEPEPKATDEQDEPTGETETQTDETSDTESEQPLYAGLTESELKAMLAKASRVDELEGQLKTTERKIFGRFGEVQEAIQKLSKTDERAEVPTGLKLSSERLKRLSEFDPDLAEALADDLSEALSPSEGGYLTQDQVDQKFSEVNQTVEQRITEAVSNATRTTEEKLLTVLQPDWREVTSDDDFGVWAGTLSPEDRQQLARSEDALWVASKIDQYKQWREKAQTAADKQRRLEDAVQPQGVGGASPGPYEDDAFEAGFKEARGIL